MSESNKRERRKKSAPAPAEAPSAEEASVQPAPSAQGPENEAPESGEAREAASPMGGTEVGESEGAAASDGAEGGDAVERHEAPDPIRTDFDELAPGGPVTGEGSAEAADKPGKPPSKPPSKRRRVTGEVEVRWINDTETTVNLAGDLVQIPGRDDLDAPTQTSLPEDMEALVASRVAPQAEVQRSHLKGVVEALVFASDKPIPAPQLAKSASADVREVKALLAELKKDYAARGVQLDEVAGGWVFRTNPVYAPFVRDLTKQKPVRLTRAQVETMAILAYRQPITRPEIDEIRGVDSGPTLKILLERNLVKILGKKDEPGRPLLYGTTPHFLEFFGLKSLKDLPTLKEFTELTEDSRRVVERELGESLENVQEVGVEEGRIQDMPDEGEPAVRDTLAPDPAANFDFTGVSEGDEEGTIPGMQIDVHADLGETMQDGPSVDLSHEEPEPKDDDSQESE